jgi:hypothetical protein
LSYSVIEGIDPLLVAINFKYRHEFIYMMNSPKILVFGLLAVVTLFSLSAITPGAISVSSTIQQVNAVESGDGAERECLSSSSALFFDSQPAVTTASV